MRRLRDEGYEVQIEGGYLLVRHVPYVSPTRQVAHGILVSKLQLSGDITAKPTDHVALWVGDHPCDANGSPLVNLVNNPNLREQVQPGMFTTCSFSQKPASGYDDYHHKMTTYVAILEGPARILDPGATARTFPVFALQEDESVFCYQDTASSRAGISAITERLERGRVAIVGLGGTGAYILDFVAKTPVHEIHLFDGDGFLQHNAFRSPGAPSRTDLEKKLSKVEWFAESYSRMRHRIVPHAVYLSEANTAELSGMDFVFLCIDRGQPKRTIVDYLVQQKVPFIDVGMGINVQNATLAGLVRTTTCTPEHLNHVERTIPFSDGESNEYAQNIQVADLNALNAALAVIKWKKLWGFYLDLEKEFHTVYGISSNLLTNDEVLDETKANTT